VRGSDEILDLAATLFLSPGDTLVNCPPTFGVYEYLGEVYNARVVNVPRNEDFTLDLPALEDVLRSGAKLLYMLVATLPQDGVALALIFSRVPFYEYYTHAPRLVASLTPLVDQTVAGAVLMIFGKATMTVAAIAVFIRWFGSEHEADRAG